ncbi:MAG TPA: tryptophan--tRNA ligase, partial [Anaeromyxobacteraceae bacterium]|nr:tryptophan--tRNA ligase [Anaeromyxobacteraceae bacterium]
ALLRLLAPPSELSDIERSWKAGGVGYGTYKKMLLDYFHKTFGEARRRHAELERDPGEIERVLADGARRARELAAPVMDAVRKAVGLR